VIIKSQKIKSLIFIYIGLLLGIIIILQILLYSFLCIEGDKIIYSIFDSIAQNTVTQIKELNESVSDIAFSLTTNSLIQTAIYDSSPRDHVQNLNYLQNTINDYKMRNKNIVMLTLVNKGKVFISSEDLPMYSTIRDIVNDIKSQNKTSAHYASSFFYNNEPYFAYITPVTPLKISYTKTHTYDNYVIAIYAIELKNSIYKNLIDDNMLNYTMTDSDSNIILSADATKLGTHIKSNEFAAAQFHKTMPIENTDWSLTVQTPQKSISLLDNFSTLFIISTLLMYVISLAIILKLFNGIIIKRINKLKESTLRVIDNDISYRIKYDYTDELSDIGIVLNQVLEKLHTTHKENIHTLEKLHDAEMLQKNTQIIYLTGQISPHFLYNSMSYIQGVAFKYNAKEIVEIVISMSKVFRYFSNNIQFSNIQRDMDCAIEYFKVLNSRRRHQLKLINNIDESLLGIACLKMIFQPIFENILEHAFDLEETGTITISSIPNDEKVIIEIADNGKGIPEDKLNEINQNLINFNLDKLQNQTHIGISNVHARLRLYYNNESGISIISSPNNGTCIRIVFDKTLPSKSEN